MHGFQENDTLYPVFNQARLAQLVVRLIRNEQVGGSNPLPGSTQKSSKTRIGKAIRPPMRVFRLPVFRCFMTLYDTPNGQTGQTMRTSMNLPVARADAAPKCPGTIWDNHGRWWWSVRLPGEPRRLTCSSFLCPAPYFTSVTCLAVDGTRDNRQRNGQCHR